MAQGLYRKVKPANEDLVVFCDKIVISEHMWAYFDFSYDETFKDKTKTVIPEFGEYELWISQDGVNYEHWVSNVAINTAAYKRQYKNAAGFIQYVKAIPSAANLPEFTTPPFPGQLFARLTVARV